MCLCLVWLIFICINQCLGICEEVVTTTYRQCAVKATLITYVNLLVNTFSCLLKKTRKYFNKYIYFYFGGINPSHLVSRPAVYVSF